jgi:predicted TIM-barrel fold metal-dependent hydrolase
MGSRGWHSDVGLHILKLFASGLFDEYPRLKIIAGHFGEMLPFMLERIMVLSKRWGERKRLFKEVYDENIWITTSGVWSVSPMACILRNTKIDHILYSVDYPFAKNEDGVVFMNELKESGLVTDEQFEMIGYRNAETLLGVKAVE